MKNLIISAVLIFSISFLFSGCYTIVWDPSQQFPDEQNYSENSEFYDTEYYGGYGSFYETPWWVVAPVYVTPIDNTMDKNQTKYRTNNGTNEGRSSDTQNIRKSGERGNTDRNSGNDYVQPTTTINSGTSSGTVIKTPPPTRDSNSGNTSTSNKTSTTSSNSSSDNGRSSSGSETRNNSGSRNTGSGRK